MQQTQVKDLMTANPEIIPSSTSLKDAARKMRTIECGVLPVGTWDNLEGIITDRDIVIRAVAEGADMATAKVQDYMTHKVFFCRESDPLTKVAEQMHKYEITRMVVKNEQGNACGIITFGCILRKNESLQEIGEVVECAVGKKAA